MMKSRNKKAEWWREEKRENRPREARTRRKRATGNNRERRTKKKSKTKVKINDFFQVKEQAINFIKH